MSTETKTTDTLTEAANNLKLATAAKNIFEATEEVLGGRRRNFTIAAAAGAVVGVGVTALSDRATTGTLVGTAIFGGLATAGIYNSRELAMHEDDGVALGITGTVVAAETALFGCVANLLFGTSPEESAE